MSGNRVNHLLEGAVAIALVSKELNYSRSHVAAILRRNKKVLGARLNREGRWVLPEVALPTLLRLVKEQSGVRYKLGATGPHRAETA